MAKTLREQVLDRERLMLLFQKVLELRGIKNLHIAETPGSSKKAIFMVPRLTVMIQGEGVWQIAKGSKVEKVAFSSGDGVFMPPHSWADGVKGHTANESLGFVFFEDFTRLVTSVYHDEQIKHVPHYYHHVASLNKANRFLLQSITECAREVDTRYLSDLIQIFLEKLFQWMNSGEGEKVGKSLWLWQNMTSFIHENAHQAITREDLARRFKINSSYVSQVFSKECGESPLAYISRIKMDKAAGYLQQSSMPVREVALSCGYEDANYFVKVFKRHYGETPSRYRMNLRR